MHRLKKLRKPVANSYRIASFVKIENLKHRPNAVIRELFQSGINVATVKNL